MVGPSSGLCISLHLLCSLNSYFYLFIFRFLITWAWLIPWVMTSFQLQLPFIYCLNLLLFQISGRENLTHLEFWTRALAMSNKLIELLLCTSH